MFCCTFLDLCIHNSRCMTHHLPSNAAYYLLASVQLPVTVDYASTVYSFRVLRKDPTPQQATLRPCLSSSLVGVSPGFSLCRFLSVFHSVTSCRLQHRTAKGSGWIRTTDLLFIYRTDASNQFIEIDALPAAPRSPRLPPYPLILLRSPHQLNGLRNNFNTHTAVPTATKATAVIPKIRIHLRRVSIFCSCNLFFSE